MAWASRSPLRCALRIDEEEVRYGILSPYSYKFYKEDTQLRYLGEIYPECGEPYVTPEHPLAVILRCRKQLTGDADLVGQ